LQFLFIYLKILSSLQLKQFTAIETSFVKKLLAASSDNALGSTSSPASFDNSIEHSDNKENNNLLVSGRVPSSITTRRRNRRTTAADNSYNILLSPSSPTSHSVPKMRELESPKSSSTSPSSSSPAGNIYHRSPLISPNVDSSAPSRLHSSSKSPQEVGEDYSESTDNIFIIEKSISPIQDMAESNDAGHASSNDEAEDSRADDDSDDSVVDLTAKLTISDMTVPLASFLSPSRPHRVIDSEVFFSPPLSLFPSSTSRLMKTPVPSNSDSALSIGSEDSEDSDLMIMIKKTGSLFTPKVSSSMKSSFPKTPQSKFKVVDLVDSDEEEEEEEEEEEDGEEEVDEENDDDDDDDDPTSLNVSSRHVVYLHMIIIRPSISLHISSTLMFFPSQFVSILYACLKKKYKHLVG
jgi:hypothetical protein